MEISGGDDPKRLFLITAKRPPKTRAGSQPWESAPQRVFDHLVNVHQFAAGRPHGGVSQLCRWLAKNVVRVQAYDPSVEELP